MKAFKIPTFLSFTVLAVIFAVSCTKYPPLMPRQAQRGLAHVPAALPMIEDCLLVNPSEELIFEEEELLLSLLVQEEMAYSVYDAFTFPMPVFDHKVGSELTHMGKVSCILDHYEIEYTLIEEPGTFLDEDLIARYDDLVSRGEDDLLEALTVGAEIEEALLCDMQSLLDMTSNEAIKTIVENLHCASWNHLRTFLIQLNARGGTYTPVCLDTEEYNAIVEGSRVLCGG